MRWKRADAHVIEIFFILKSIDIFLQEMYFSEAKIIFRDRKFGKFLQMETNGNCVGIIFEIFDFH